MYLYIYNIYIVALLCVGNQYTPMPNPSPETEETTFVCVYTGKVREYSVPHPGPRSTCVLWYWRLVKPEAALGEYVKA